MTTCSYRWQPYSETADHIADLSDGWGSGDAMHSGSETASLKRYATTRRGSLIEFSEASRLAEWLDDFPDRATEELGLSDASILDAWQRACERHPNQRVYIWTLHQRLQAYDHQP